MAAANAEAIYTLNVLQTVVDKNRSGAVLLECRNGRIGYFRVD
jgi:serine protease Do